MCANANRLRDAAALIRAGRSLPVGDVLLSGEGKDVLSVTGWTNAHSVSNLSHKSALDELDDVKHIFQDMIAACPDLLDLAGKDRVKFRLCLDYGMGAVDICSEIDGILIWGIDLDA